MADSQEPNTNAAEQYYATQLGNYDEMYATATKALPYWERFMGALDRLGDVELEQRRREAQRLLRENGVTYNVYGDAQKLSRPWQLDPIPLLISQEEWQSIEAGLKQRANLLDLILKDLYGKQMLLKKGLLPSELIYAHSGFLRPCVGAIYQKQRHLTLYSANLARGPNGRMWVLDDRTQAPSGSGYALENRTVMTRVLPDILRETQVKRLGGFFKSLRQELIELAPHNKEDPRIVILTPGSLNETYFEHAYLASHLGFTLAQGDDLTLRDGRVWLKSLDGLQAVDVILRRVDDSFCDPLTLNSQSRLGVAGLLEAVRRGNVAVANPLGSSVLENPALLAFLPRISRYFLNQELKLPSVATWWCGQKREREFVLQNLDRLVIKPINRTHAQYALFGGLLSVAEKATLQAQILAKPHEYIAQEQISFSTLPAFINQHIEPRNAVLRTFAVASGEDYAVMPGGLTRIAPDKSVISVSNQEGGISKDTWVLSAGVETISEIAKSPKLTTLPSKLDGVTEPLTSRAADNMFWVGRHLERTEASARLLRVILLKILETADDLVAIDADCQAILLRALTQVTGTYPGFIQASEQELKAPHARLLALAKEQHCPGTLSANINALVRSANSIRDLWSQDTWRSIDHIQRRWQIRVIENDCTIEQLQKQLEELLSGIVAFTGLTSENMPREAAWLMLYGGRRLERAQTLIALLRAALVVKYAEPLQNQILEAVLRATDSLTLYQRRYRAFIQLPMVLELLLFDETHPRSLVYQLHQLNNHLQGLPKMSNRGQLSDCERLMLKVYTDIRLCKTLDLLSETSPEVFIELEDLLSTTANVLWKVADVIAETYFSHAQSVQVLMLKSQNDEL